MASEIRVDTIKNSAGLGTIAYTGTSIIFSGDLTATTLSASGPLSIGVTPFFRNVSTIASNYTVTTTYNEMSIGPITINTGITVTVNSGATWTVV